MYDLAIVGGGPAGVAAGVYAARKRLKTIFIAESVGGQSIDSLEIQNWIGTEKISGLDLAKSLEAHLRAYASDIVELQLGTRASKVSHTEGGFSVETNKGSFSARAVLIVTGGSRRKLGVPGADTFENKGVVYCASCDGPLFSGQDVVVVGGGNAGLESAAQLLAYCPSVTLIHRQATFTRADQSTIDAVLAKPNFTALMNTEPTAVLGETFVNAIEVKNTQTGEVRTLPTKAVFVEIGMLANTDLVQGLVELNAQGKVVVDGKTQRTSVTGIWAAGDCSDGLYHQNNIAAGDAVKALEDIYYFLSK